MKHYLIEILWSNPYPLTETLRIESSSLASACGKALRQFRKIHKGKRLKQLTIRIRQYD